MHRLTRSHCKAVARFWAWAVWSMDIQEQLTATEDAAAQEGGQHPSALSPGHLPITFPAGTTSENSKPIHPETTPRKFKEEGLFSAAWAAGMPLPVPGGTACRTGWAGRSDSPCSSWVHCRQFTPPSNPYLETSFSF